MFGAIGLAVGSVACGDDGDDDPGDSPGSTAKAFAEARARGDCSQQADLASSRALDNAGGRDGYITDCEDDPADSDLPDDLEISEIDILQESKTHAEVRVSGRSAQQRDQVAGISHGTTVNLRFEDGSWKVDNEPQPDRSL